MVRRSPRGAEHRFYPGDFRPTYPGSPVSNRDLERLVVVGAGGMGREMFEVLQLANALESRFELLGFLDDDPPQSDLLDAYGPVLGGTERLVELGASFMLGFGQPSVRRRFDEIGRAAALESPVIVEQTSIVRSTAVLGPGTHVGTMALINSWCKIGRQVRVGFSALVAHDSVVGDYVNVRQGALVSGGVTIGDDAVIGAGAIVLENLTIGAGATVGAGAIVTRDVKPGETVVGNPARPLRRR